MFLITDNACNFEARGRQDEESRNLGPAILKIPEHLFLVVGTVGTFFLPFSGPTGPLGLVWALPH